MGWLFEFFGEILVQILFEGLIKWPGIWILRSFFGTSEQEADGCLAVLIGLAFWGVLGLVFWLLAR
jgi:hypothetical protein